MATNTVTVHLRIRYAWWLWPYLRILAALAELLDREPDLDKVDRMIARGTRIETVPAGDDK
jgi:hypothetical protein